MKSDFLSILTARPEWDLDAEELPEITFEEVTDEELLRFVQEAPSADLFVRVGTFDGWINASAKAPENSREQVINKLAWVYLFALGLMVNHKRSSEWMDVEWWPILKSSKISVMIDFARPIIDRGFDSPAATRKTYCLLLARMFQAQNGVRIEDFALRFSEYCDLNFVPKLKPLGEV